MQTRLIRGIGGMPAFMAALVIAAMTALWLGVAATAQTALDADDIGGVVRSPSGPEAGVWVIAETDDFDTRFRKIVVTDDAGRYVLPDLPDAGYDIWVRGYGLRDSEPVSGRPGDSLDLDAVPAADAREAAQVYPANYWYSLVEVPAEDEFPGT
ncbi:MAG: carboxypeptidase-like regulatory domain-containing protein, partial [Acidobacteria bacterium]|nr:carboxypeptidase-like regulatory domain-containing protein [Acidobacteriota bacterium]